MDNFTSQSNQQGSSGMMGQNSQSSGLMGTSGQSTQQGGQKQDYVDKAFDFVSKKAGHDLNPQTDEKITDAGRSAYEKMTGKKVSDKVSN